MTKAQLIHSAGDFARAMFFVGFVASIGVLAVTGTQQIGDVTIVRVMLAYAFMLVLALWGMVALVGTAREASTRHRKARFARAWNDLIDPESR